MGALLSVMPELRAQQADPNAQTQAELESLTNALSNTNTSGIANQVQGFENDVLEQINDMNFPKPELKVEALKNMSESLKGVSGQVNTAIAGVKGQISQITGPINEVKAKLDEAKAKIVNLFYINPLDLPDPPFKNLPWIEYSNPALVGPSALLTGSPPKLAYCNACCSRPGEIAKHLIKGGDPLGEESLQDYITKKMLPPILQSIKLLAPPITGATLLQPALEGNLRNAQLGTRVLDQRNAASADILLNGQVSNQVCRIASVAQSLGASDLYARTVQMSVSDTARDRALMRMGMSSGFTDAKRLEGNSQIGQAADNAGRWDLYRRSFCNKNDPNVKEICLNTDPAMNDRDINFANATSYYKQIDINIAPVTGSHQNSTNFGSKDFDAVMALSNNLYAHDLSFTADDVGRNNAERLMGLRSTLAMRNVVQNSYSAFVAARASGVGGNSNSMKALMAELKGEQSLDVEADIFGARPSYEAQMDALSRKLYQTDAFYKNLMENPANVKRQQVAMQAVDLMNKHDIAQSLERTEMLMALWLEVKLRKKQAQIENQFNQDSGGR